MIREDEHRELRKIVARWAASGAEERLSGAVEAFLAVERQDAVDVLLGAFRSLRTVDERRMGGEAC